MVIINPYTTLTDPDEPVIICTLPCPPQIKNEKQLHMSVALYLHIIKVWKSLFLGFFVCFFV